MSAPQDRLISDEDAHGFELGALAALACRPFIPASTEELAAATIALLRDRQARLELARQA